MLLLKIQFCAFSLHSALILIFPPIISHSIPSHMLHVWNVYQHLSEKKKEKSPSYVSSAPWVAYGLQISLKNPWNPHGIVQDTRTVKTCRACCHPWPLSQHFTRDPKVTCSSRGGRPSWVTHNDGSCHIGWWLYSPEFPLCSVCLIDFQLEITSPLCNPCMIDFYL